MLISLACFACALLAAAMSGCGSELAVDDAVDHGDSLVSEEGQIAFTRATKFNWTNWTSSESDIYAINVDGSGERRLTDSPGLNGFPTWSPGGERLAFVSAREGSNSEIYVMDADGSGQRRLTHTSANEFFLAWSPDGERIAYTAYDFGYNATIWVMDADGSERRGLGDVSLIRRITGTAQLAEEPAWSPDGKRIAFASEDNGEIYVMNADGTERTRLTDHPGYDHWPPSWSPGGTRIAFTSAVHQGEPRDLRDELGQLWAHRSDR